MRRDQRRLDRGTDPGIIVGAGHLDRELPRRDELV